MTECSLITTVGVDYAGPLVIKHYTYTSSKGFRMYHSCSWKAWVALFTCAVSQVVYFEIDIDLTPSSFLRCLRDLSPNEDSFTNHLRQQFHFQVRLERVAEDCRLIIHELSSTYLRSVSNEFLMWSMPPAWWGDSLSAWCN